MHSHRGIIRDMGSQQRTTQNKSLHYFFNRRFGKNIQTLLDRNVSGTPGILTPKSPVVQRHL